MENAVRSCGEKGVMVLGDGAISSCIGDGSGGNDEADDEGFWEVMGWR